MRHRQLEHHDPENPACDFDPENMIGGDDHDWCSCPLPARATMRHSTPPVSGVKRVEPLSPPTQILLDSETNHV